MTSFWEQAGRGRYGGKHVTPRTEAEVSAFTPQLDPPEYADPTLDDLAVGPPGSAQRLGHDLYTAWTEGRIPASKALKLLRGLPHP